MCEEGRDCGVSTMAHRPHLPVPPRPSPWAIRPHTGLHPRLPVPPHGLSTPTSRFQGGCDSLDQQNVRN